MQTAFYGVRKFVCYIFIFTILQSVLFARTFELSEFLRAIEKHSIELLDNKAKFESALAEGKSNLAWEYPYIEASGGTAREGGKLGADWEVAVVFKPRLFWVDSFLKQGLQAKGEQYHKSQSLIRNLNFIHAKRIYLTYVATKEKYHYFLQRERNFLKLLSIAKKRLTGGSISQKDYVSFESAYLGSRLASVAVRNDLLELQRDLFVLLGLDGQHYAHILDDDIDDPKNSLETVIHNIENHEQEDDLGQHAEIVVRGLDFAFLDISQETLQEKLATSLYTQLLELQTKEYQALAKYEGRNLWGSLEFGAGVKYSLSTYNPSLQTSIPLPVTRKQSHLKAKYMALESNTLTKMAITKKQVGIKAKAYLQELIFQKHYIDIAEKTMQAKEHLAYLNRLGYEAQQVTLFEYITQENALVDSQIALVDSRIKYIDLLSLLEETVGESFVNVGSFIDQ